MIILFITLTVLVILSLLFLYMIKPNRRPVECLKGLAIAHRGLHGNGIPENSLAAFRAARSRGLPVEFDVQYTKDRQLVVFHDGTLKRMCGKEGRVLDYTYEEIRTLGLSGTDERIPLLSEVLGTLGDSFIVMELKYYDGISDCRICADVCRYIDSYPGRIVVESFSPFLLRWFRKHRPDILRGQLASDFIADHGELNAPLRFVMRNLLVNVLSRPDFIAYHFNYVRSAGFSVCRQLWHPVTMAWTPRDTEQKSAAEKRFDSIIAENF